MIWALSPEDDRLLENANIYAKCWLIAAVRTAVVGLQAHSPDRRNIGTGELQERPQRSAKATSKGLCVGLSSLSDGPARRLLGAIEPYEDAHVITRSWQIVTGWFVISRNYKAILTTGGFRAHTGRSLEPGSTVAVRPKVDISQSLEIQQVLLTSSFCRCRSVNREERHRKEIQNEKFTICTSYLTSWL